MRSQINKKAIILVVTFIVIIFGSFAISVVYAAKCPKPCPSVIDISFAKQIIEWYENFSNPYVKQIDLEHEIEMRMRRAPGMLGDINKAYFNASFNHQKISEELVNEHIKAKNDRYVQRSNKDYANMYRTVQSMYAVKTYNEAKAILNSTYSFDDAIKQISPLKVSAGSAYEAQKSAVQLGLIQTDILSSMLKIIGKESEYESFSSK